MYIGLDAGHTLSGLGTGASCYASETDMNRKVHKRLTEMLTEKGHKVHNCTVDKSNSDLSDRVNKANSVNLDLFVSLHLNAYQKTNNAMGVETYHYPSSSKGKTYATNIQNELVKEVGWKNRGIKTANFYVIKNTKAPAILVELGFCDSKVDMDLFDVEKVCKALFKGITGVEYKSTTTTAKPIYRVVIDGKHVGSYTELSNIIEQIKNHISNAKKVEITRI